MTLYLLIILCRLVWTHTSCCIKYLIISLVDVFIGGSRTLFLTLFYVTNLDSNHGDVQTVLNIQDQIYAFHIALKESKLYFTTTMTNDNSIAKSHIIVCKRIGQFIIKFILISCCLHHVSTMSPPNEVCHSMHHHLLLSISTSMS